MIVLRKAGYEGAVYRIQYDQTSIYPFVSMVLYWGEGVWNAPRNIRQLFDMDGMREGEFVDDIRLHVYEMTSLPREVRQRFQSDMRIVVDYLAEGKNYVPTRQKIVHLEALLMMLSALTGDVRYEEIVPEMQKEEKEKGEIDMCELLDKYENRGVERGLAEGISRVNELIRHLIGDGRSAEIEKAVSDVEYQNQLFFEYHL